MQSDPGFFVHQAMTYGCIMPFLKGFFLTVNIRTGKRDKEGWKMSDKEWIMQLLEKTEEDEGQRIAHKILESLEDEGSNHTNQENGRSNPLNNQQDSPLNQVKAAERLRDNISAIVSMFSNETPPEVGIHLLEIFSDVYGFGDASGKRFGSAIQGNNGLSYQIGVWAENESDESSNWREFPTVYWCLKKKQSKEISREEKSFSLPTTQQ
ncbi:hypothetical protein ACA910_006425 [Epithemia clementina (nom. ined.)]